MSAYKANPHYLIIIIDLYDQSVFVSLNVENYTITPENACAGILPLQFVGMFPGSLAGFPIPRFELFFTIRMNCPKFSQYFFCNYSQITKVIKSSHYGNRGLVFLEIFIVLSKTFPVLYKANVTLDALFELVDQHELVGAVGSFRFSRPHLDGGAGDPHPVGRGGRGVCCDVEAFCMQQ